MYSYKINSFDKQLTSNAPFKMWALCCQKHINKEAVVDKLKIKEKTKGERSGDNKV